MLLDLEVGRRVGRVEPVSLVRFAPSPVARDLAARGQESAERTTITWKYQADS